MTKFWILVAIAYKIVYVDNRMIPLNNLSETEIYDAFLPKPTPTPTSRPESSIDLVAFPNTYEAQRKKKPCSIVVLSNVHNPNTQSLLRRYRYDSNGILIPSSVKYFFKVPRGSDSFPILVPLNDKAFSPLGGFVRYYKEVPPIPQSW